MALSALDLIKSARRLLNIDASGDSIDAGESEESFDVLNMLIDSMDNQRLNVPSLKNVTGTLSAAKNPHTVGTGGDINISRPLRIERAFCRLAALTTPVDFPMDQINNNQYQDLAVKNISTSYPTHFYYEATYPLASLYVYPVQVSALELHMSVWDKLTRFSAITTEISLPEGYENLFRYMLAVELAPMYGKALTKGDFVFDRAAELLRDIKSINQQTPNSVLDSVLTSTGRSSFQIYRGF
jgi:hypothetical protein